MNRYDVAGRRNAKAINGTHDMDGQFHHYVNDQSVIKECNGSNDVIKQDVWGLGCVDEAAGKTATPKQAAYPFPPSEVDRGNSEGMPIQQGRVGLCGCHARKLVLIQPQ